MLNMDTGFFVDTDTVTQVLIRTHVVCICLRLPEGLEVAPFDSQVRHMLVIFSNSVISYTSVSSSHNIVGSWL